MGIICWKFNSGVSANAKMPRLGSKAAKAKLKEIGGSLYERWSVWFNSTIRVESYQCIERKIKQNLIINDVVYV